ncbi:MAG TPA: hypothetical protein VGO93_26945, partial [Candidatus Xenobia bacterium]
MNLLTEAARSIPEARYTRTVLMVHDKSPLRRELSRELRFSGYRVFEASTIEDTMRVSEREAAKQDIHLLIVDAAQVKETEDLALKVRALYPGLPVLVLSAEAQPGTL